LIAVPTLSKFSSLYSIYWLKLSCNFSKIRKSIRFVKHFGY